PPAGSPALTRGARGRRVFVNAPEHSLVLRKASGAVAHGGGLRIPRSSVDYQTLRDWIAAGVPFRKDTDPKVTAIRVEQKERLLDLRGTEGARYVRQQLRVMARYSD